MPVAASTAHGRTAAHVVTRNNLTKIIILCSLLNLFGLIYLSFSLSLSTVSLGPLQRNNSELKNRDTLMG